MTDKHIDSPLADDDGDAIKRITPARFAELDKSTVTLLDLREPDEVLVHALNLSDQLFLSGQVGLLYALLGNNVLILLLEEIITSRDKTFPDSVGMLTG